MALAFGLVIAAGFSTMIGGALAMFSGITTPRNMAIALGVSAGVMMYVLLQDLAIVVLCLRYVSFGEIFLVKAVDGFTDAGYSDDSAMAYATFCFFAGVILTALLNAIVSCITTSNNDSSNEVGFPKTSKMETLSNGATMNAAVAPKDKDLSPAELESGGDPHQEEKQHSLEIIHDPSTDQDRSFQLQKVGLMSSLVVGLHNFPEGLATFVGTLADPTAGVAITVAIALHNIPEGVMVAMALNYASKSRFKGLFWATICGLTEPIGALFGWLLLSNLGDLTYAILFGIVAGIMVYISIRELIPEALKFDAEDRVVTVSVLFGMALMASSLLLFTL